MPGDEDWQKQGLNSSGRRPERTLAVVFSDIARTLQAETSLDATLQAVVESALSNVEGADHAGRWSPAAVW